MDAGHTSWMLTASALMLLMMPGLAFFYGGLVRARNVVSTMYPPERAYPRCCSSFFR
jgi:Amt family ammonium transporter